jgi:hypothetical protein
MGGRLRFLLPLVAVILIMSAPVVADAGFRQTSLPVDARPDAHSRAAARVVGSILTYSRWPAPPDPIRLCVLGPAHYDAALKDVLPGGIRVDRRDLPASAVGIAAACDALYLGAIGQPAMAHALAQVRGAAVVTIAEHAPQCRGEAMFCLIVRDRTVSFALNLDAVSRSRVRIDPRVLRISRGFRE